MRMYLSVLIHLFLLSSPSFGAEWHVYKGSVEDLTTSNKPLSDKEYTFYLDKMRCGVTKTELKKMDGNVFEMRHLYCWVTKDTRVSISLDYNVRATTGCSDSRTLYIDRKGKPFHPWIALSCPE
jgi:hypothetical protein